MVTIGLLTKHEYFGICAVSLPFFNRIKKGGHTNNGHAKMHELPFESWKRNNINKIMSTCGGFHFRSLFEKHFNCASLTHETNKNMEEKRNKKHHTNETRSLS